MKDSLKYTGLTPDQVEASCKQHGQNMLKMPKSSGLWFILKAAVAEPMLMLLVAAVIIYFLMGSTREAVIMLVAIGLVATISIIQESPFDPMEAELQRVFEKTSPTRLPAHDGLTMLLGYPLEGKPPMMTHIWQGKEKGRIIAVKGAPEALMNMSALSTEDRAALLDATASFTSKGFRVLAVGKSDFPGTNFPESQQSLPFQILGLVAFNDPPKAGMAKVLAAFYQAGCKSKS